MIEMIEIGDKVESKICKNLFGIVKDIISDGIVIILLHSDKELVADIKYWNKI